MLLYVFDEYIQTKKKIVRVWWLWAGMILAKLILMLVRCAGAVLSYGVQGWLSGYVWLRS